MEKHEEAVTEKMKHLDFLTSVILFLVSLFIVMESNHIFSAVGGPVYSSPGLLPIFIGTMLMLCSVILFFKSIKNVGIIGSVRTLVNWFKPFIREQDTKGMLLGIAILGIFSFFLVPRLPFVLSSVIFMVVLMKVLDAGSYLKIGLLSVSVSASLYILFEVIFSVPLP